MEKRLHSDDICVLTKDHFFKSDVNFHIQISNEFPDYIGIVHQHKYIEMVYIISGKATHKIREKTYTAVRGDLFIINKDTPHVFYCDPDSKEPFIAYDLMFTPEFFDESIPGYGALEDLASSFVLYSLFGDDQEVYPYLSVSGSSYTMFGELFHKIYMEHRGKEKGYIEIIRAYLLQLIVSIFRINDSSAMPGNASQNKQAVRYIVDYINQNYGSRLSVQELADKVYMNRNYLGRIFRNETGMTIGEMIRKVRLGHVCDLLKATDRTVNDIATSCGFLDMKFFYNTFKNHMGVLPKEYRKRSREEINKNENK